MLRRIDEALLKAMHRREANANTLRPMRVEERFEDGTIGLRRMDGECVERGNECSAYPGEIIEIPCGKPIRLTGAATVPWARTRRDLATLWVERITPDVFSPGGSYTVLVDGNGFTNITTFDFLMPGTFDVNPDITIDEIRYVSAVRMEIDLTVAMDAHLIPVETGDIAFDNPGAPL